MPDIFNKDVVVKQGPLARSETAALYVNDKRVALAQQVNINYGVALQNVYELGSVDYYMVSGRTRGQMSIARVVGVVGPAAGVDSGTTLRQILPDTLPESFWEVDGSVGGVLTIEDTATGVKFKCSGCYVSDYATSVAADGSIMNENVNIMFHKLEIDVGAVG